MRRTAPKKFGSCPVSKLHPVSADWASRAYVNADRYQEMYRRSLEEPEAFWREESARLDWIKPWTKLNECSFNEADFGIKWFEDGTLNVSVNCLDRHLDTRGDELAIIWEGDDPAEYRTFTYRELHDAVCRAGASLRALGVKKGDRVTIYLPMIPEAAIAMLACARIGAIHSVVFAGFSPDALAGRIQDCDSTVVITADGGMRGSKLVPLKENVDKALESCPSVEYVLVVGRTGIEIDMKEDRDISWYAQLSLSNVCEPEEMNAEDPLFILYTSGSTGKPKG
ncbi:MAG: AMP-binding protein, partial [Novosphingobium sp.]|nr:AMP-binding protein [Novosphingobium sp.]